MIWSRRLPGLIVGVALAYALPANAGGALLYDQTDSAGSSAVISTDYEPPSDSFDTQIADDFTVPADQSWAITQLDVKGTFFLTIPPPPLMNVFLYADEAGLPGTDLFHQVNISATNAPDYSIPLAGAPSLLPGTYWVSAQQAGGQMNLGEFSDWSWRSRTVESGHPAAYRNPGGGYTPKCTDWGALTPCNSPLVGPDVAFKLSGTASPFPPLSPTLPQPSNQFRIGKVKRNLKKGTARLTVTVPGPGTLELAGKGLVRRPARSATARAKLLIKAIGKAKQRLDRTGRVKVKAIITFTPTGGTPSTKRKGILLKKLSR
jgi:hypothetical protein